ncbi:MAG: NAD(P)H-binding protein [Actinomycetes bacterium]
MGSWRPPEPPLEAAVGLAGHGISRPPRLTSRTLGGGLGALPAAPKRWTIVRPGHLTDAPGSGRVRVSRTLGRAEVPRDDVALVRLECLHARTRSASVRGRGPGA